MATKRKGTLGPTMEDLEIRIKSSRPAKERPVRERAADRRSDLERGYPKAGMRPGTVDLGSEGAMASSRGEFITRNPVAGVNAGGFLDPHIDALGAALGNPGAPRLRQAELMIPRPSKRKRKE